jgi:hypothetical protein
MLHSSIRWEEAATLRTIPTEGELALREDYDHELLSTEAETKATSDRTKAALAAAKAKGTKLGSARPGH